MPFQLDEPHQTAERSRPLSATSAGRPSAEKVGTALAGGHWELGLIILTGILHVVVELVWGGARGRAVTAGRPEQIYNLIVAGLWGGYVLWRATTAQGVARLWGFRWDNFSPALRLSLCFSLLAAVPLVVYGSLMGRLALPATFWVALSLYPLYGIAQQFALQALMTRNLRVLIGPQSLRVLLVATLFSAVHFPNRALMILALIAGLGFTWIYEKHPNLSAIGIAHGLLGALAYYLVLGLDPGAEIVAAVHHAIPRW